MGGGVRHAHRLDLYVRFLRSTVDPRQDVDAWAAPAGFHNDVLLAGCVCKLGHVFSPQPEVQAHAVGHNFVDLAE